MTELGLLAGALTTGCWLPQLRRSWRTRSTEDFSWTYLTLLIAGVGAWLAYGLGSGDVAIVVANALTFLFLLSIALIKATEPQALVRSDEEAMVAEPSTVSPS
ncbi:SemiSWEET family sugar transporter [Actinocorallia longicatena]|uniref:MtN3 and saliva related transmembrane protein n=1 Tax=Actinocorallia longicatena TaxID=111803 RepID=A0ABP6PZF6_9ACTN